MRAFDRRFVYDLQKGRRKSMIALTASSASQGSLHYGKKMQLQFFAIRTVQLFRFYLSNTPNSF